MCHGRVKAILFGACVSSLVEHQIQATKEAEANLIKRREETAAARSQANTAKLLAENPIPRAAEGARGPAGDFGEHEGDVCVGVGGYCGADSGLMTAERE